MRYFVDVGGEELELELESLPDGSFRVRHLHASGPSEARVLRVVGRAHDLYSVELDGRILELRVGRDGEPNRVLGLATRVSSARERAARGERAAAASSKELRAPMPGRILRVLCAPGTQVAKGEPLVIMEAMKMENELLARAAATVSEVRVSAGDTVERDAVLLVFE